MALITPLNVLVETILVSLLPKEYRRINNRLTDLERERLGTSFEEVWEISHRLSQGHSHTHAESELHNMELPHLLRLKEVAAFLFANITDEERADVAAFWLQLQGQDTIDYNDSLFMQGMEKIFEIFNQRIGKERGGLYYIPDGAPLGIFSIFDHWQDEVNECKPIK